MINIMITKRISIEVFKTNLNTLEDANQLREALWQHFNNCQINFDLEDCDKILRMEGENIEPEFVIEIAKTIGFTVEELPE